MKILSMLLFGWIICSAACLAQGFRYDTIPANQVSNRQLFRYDTIRTHSKPAQYSRTVSPTESQHPSPSKFKKENLVLGGTFGLNFGNHYTAFNFSPQIGYRFSQYFTAGVGLGYSYYKEDGGKDKDWTQNYLGGNLYLQLNPIQYIRLQVQPELYSFWGSYHPNTSVVPCLLAGAGIHIPAGRNGGISMMLYYDVIQDDDSPYGNQLIYSVGYTFGF